MEPKMHKTIDVHRPQSTRFWWTVAICSLVGGVVILGVTMVGYYTGTPLNHLVVDPADYLWDAGTGFQIPAYVGLLSHLGTMLWSASAAFCFIGAMLLVRGRQEGEPATVGSQRRSGRQFLFWSSAVCALLMFDDALLLHDRVFPYTFGVDERIVYVVYATFIILYVISFARRILATDYELLFLAASFVGASVLADRLLPFTPLETFLEDSMKFIGILFWAAYFGNAAIAVCTDELNIGRISEKDRSKTQEQSRIMVESIAK
ncbi:MAG: hypothetical protein HYY49_08430 [Ignavibacteriales bacterium]|nr:hypothetical protein [Ignavibacteriales bacterium]